jgi:polyisoprenoid-binding protein YceI
MKRFLIIFGAALALVVIGVTALLAIQLLRSDNPDLATEAPALPASATLPGPDTAPATGIFHFVIDPAQSSVKYVVKETLRGLETTTVGQTSTISGEIYLTRAGLATDRPSKFQVDLRTLRSDESQRDSYLRSNVLLTAKYPFADFVVEQLTNFPTGSVEGQQVQLQLTGSMTMHGVTKPLTFSVLARQAGDTLTATADTDFNMTDFSIFPPNVLVAKAQNAVHLQVILVAKQQTT